MEVSEPLPSCAVSVSYLGSGVDVGIGIFCVPLANIYPVDGTSLYQKVVDSDVTLLVSDAIY